MGRSIWPLDRSTSITPMARPQERSMYQSARSVSSSGPKTDKHCSFLPGHPFTRRQLSSRPNERSVGDRIHISADDEQAFSYFFAAKVTGFSSPPCLSL